LVGWEKDGSDVGGGVGLNVGKPMEGRSVGRALGKDGDLVGLTGVGFTVGGMAGPLEGTMVG